MSEKLVIDYFGPAVAAREKVSLDQCVLLKLRLRMRFTWMLFVPFCIFMLWLSAAGAAGVSLWPGLHLEAENGQAHFELILSHKSWESGFYSTPGDRSYHPWRERANFPRLDWNLHGSGIYLGMRPIYCSDPSYRGAKFVYENVFLLSFPLWLCFLPACIIPIRTWRILRRLNRRINRRRELTLPTTHCRQCGYDLRASPLRCPECGSLVRRRTTSGLEWGTGE